MINYIRRDFNRLKIKLQNLTCISPQNLPQKVYKKENYFKLTLFNEPQSQLKTFLVDLYKIERYGDPLSMEPYRRYYYFEKITPSSVKKEDLFELNLEDYQRCWWLFSVK